jgi:hypothetical protein
VFTSEWPREPLDGADTIGVNPKPFRERRGVINDPGVWNVLKQPYGVARPYWPRSHAAQIPLEGGIVRAGSSPVVTTDDRPVYFDVLV